MDTNPTLGVAIFALGGLAGAVFYLPFKKVANWAWESYWLVYAVAGLVIVPWALALSTSPNLLAVLRNVPVPELARCFLFGAMWGVGGLTWGLMIRYLGVGLGLAIGCGICSAAGTLVPPILEGKFATLWGTPSANAALAGVAVSILGIVLVGMAGMSKESELPDEAKKKAVAEYDFKLGLAVAIFSGLMSAGMSWGLAGSPSAHYKAQYGSTTQVVRAAQGIGVPSEIDKTGRAKLDEGGYWIAPSMPEDERVTSATWSGMPVLVVVLAGGFVVNALWCIFLNVKNSTLGDYTKKGAPLVGNLFFAGLAGAIWCSQFICFKTGEPAMGEQKYIGWAVLMASAILFSTLLGIFLGEWNGTSGRTRGLLALGLLMLLASAGIAAYSGYEKKETDRATTGAKQAATSFVAHTGTT